MQMTNIAPQQMRLSQAQAGSAPTCLRLSYHISENSDSI